MKKLAMGEEENILDNLGTDKEYYNYRKLASN